MSSSKKLTPIDGDAGRIHHHELVFVGPVFGQHSSFSIDRLELADAAWELPCGCLPGRCKHNHEEVKR